MPKNTAFCSKWLQKLDNTGRVCSRWLKKGKTTSSFQCIVCRTDDLSCANGGWADIKRHFDRPKHIQCMKDVFGSVSLIASNDQSPPLSNNKDDNSVCTATVSINGNTTRIPFVTIQSDKRVLTHEEKVTQAECIWAMATAQLGFSFNSSQFLPEIFRSMFPDSQIAADYSLRQRKLSYVISHGTGYYFTNELIKDVRKAYGFSLLFDETTIAGVRKQLDIFFRYWSEAKNCICVRFYKSIILGHATADIISRSIIDSLKADGIDIAKMLMLGRDNPNVNKAIEEILNKEIITERKKKSSSVPVFGLISIGSCPLHVIHGSFRKGIKSTSWFIDEALNDMWFWFSRSAARRQDFKLVANSINEIYSRFLNRFVDTRWIEKELIKSLPINNDFLRHLQCLQPSARKEQSSRTSIMYLARNLPHLLTNEEVDRVGAEWRVYEMADIPEDWIKRNTNSLNNVVEYVPIDTYWYHVFSTHTTIGTPQYVTLTKLVKCLLSLSHGNSDVERGFSQNNHLVSDERSSLNEASINGLRVTNAGVKFFGGGKVHMVPTTATLISNVQEAHSRYIKDNEEQQKLIKSIDVVNGKRASDAEHERLEENEIELLNKQKNLQQELMNATKMLEEGSVRLATALSNKTFDDVGTAEVLVTAANAKLAVLKTQLIENNENLNRMRKKQKK
ncbi:unnamed protein product [Rotaria sp. Silwood1]|nr:unnamed protein product [Rotaria sp. Silwood1]CAF1629593.1 unnamed protein product [Rotaria sp. Silwood1]CAF3736930.1 unnamed protein product [Rotaria sp. Silwood1]CAF4955981.1 unnamed protein product [Rotaria sp. Silwood1]